MNKYIYLFVALGNIAVAVYATFNGLYAYGAILAAWAGWWWNKFYNLQKES